MRCNTSGIVFPRVAVSQTCPHNAGYTRGLTKTIVGPSGLGSSACSQPSLGRTNFSQAGPILDAKNGPAGQTWSTKFGPAGPVLVSKIGPAGPNLPGPIFP